MDKILSLIILVLLTSCASAQQKHWEEISERDDFKAERTAYQEKLGGKQFCLRTGVASFTFDGTPSRSCLYPPDGYVDTDKGPAQYAKQLKVLQTGHDGYIVQKINKICSYGSCYDRTSPNVIFIKKTDENQDIVDGSYLDETTDAFYEYTGPFNYETALGPKTVHSFKKVSVERLHNAAAGLKVYNPDSEISAELKLWDRIKIQ